MRLRRATHHDLAQVVGMLADDMLGKSRESIAEPLPPEYSEAFRLIDADPNQELLVLETPDGQIAGTLQLTFIAGLSLRGSLRANVEAVRVHRDFRGQGIGKRMLKLALDRARERGARIAQLASNTAREDAIRFYKEIGFKATHVGMKMEL